MLWNLVDTLRGIKPLILRLALRVCVCFVYLNCIASHLYQHYSFNCVTPTPNTTTSLCITIIATYYYVRTSILTIRFVNSYLPHIYFNLVWESHPTMHTRGLYLLDIVKKYRKLPRPLLTFFTAWGDIHLLR